MNMLHPEYGANDIPSTPQQAKRLYDVVQDYADQCGEPEQRRRDFAFYGKVMTRDIHEGLMAHQEIPELPVSLIGSTEDDMSIVLHEGGLPVDPEYRLVAGVQVHRAITKKNNKAYYASTNFKVQGRKTDEGLAYRLRFSTNASVQVPVTILTRAQELLEADPDELAVVTDPDIILEVERLRNPHGRQGFERQAAAFGEELRELYEVNRVTFTEADLLIGAIRQAADQLS